MQIGNTWRCGDRLLEFGARPLLMGILNVTPDSFSDGGCFVAADVAVERALRMVDEGAEIVDIGGESSRPGAAPVDGEEESARVVPVIEALRLQRDVPISIDTTKASVARAAVGAGASIVNDISAGMLDSGLLDVAAESGCGLVLMHMQGTPQTMQRDPHYADVVSEVSDFLQERIVAAQAAGVARECIAVDPGIGFGKTLAHNLALLAATRELAAGGVPVLIGLSRKRFLEELTGRGVEQRLAGSLAALVYCALSGAAVMRVHDVAESRDALLVAAAIATAVEERARP